MIVGETGYGGHCVHQLFGLQKVSEQVVLKADLPAGSIPGELAKSKRPVSVVESAERCILPVFSELEVVQHDCRDADDGPAPQVVELNKHLRAPMREAKARAWLHREPNPAIAKRCLDELCQ